MSIQVLLRKDLRENAGWLAGSAILVLAFEAAVASRIGFWERGTVSLVALLPLLVIPPLTIVRGYRALKREWDAHTASFLFALPISRFSILLAKTVPAVIFVLILTFGTTLPFLAIVHKELGMFPAETFVGRTLAGSLIYALVPATLGVLALCSYAVTRCVRRARTIVGFTSFLASLVAWWGAGALLSRVVPDAVRPLLTWSLGHLSVDVSLPSIVAPLATSLLFWGLAGMLLERRLEC